MLKNIQSLKKYFGEGLLIVFSVLFALFINKTYESSKTNRYKDNALKQIRAELLENQKTLNDWMANHRAIAENLDRLIGSKDNGIQALAKEKNTLLLPILLDERNLIDQSLSSSAWTSAQSSGILSEFDFKTLQHISQPYELQQYIRETSIDKIAEKLLSETTDVDKVTPLLIELKLRFQNLLGQEQRLKEIYAKTVEVLK